MCKLIKEKVMNGKFKMLGAMLLLMSISSLNLFAVKVPTSGSGLNSSIGSPENLSAFDTDDELEARFSESEKIENNRLIKAIEDSSLNEENLKNVKKAKRFKFDDGFGKVLQAAAKEYVDSVAGIKLSELEAQRAFGAFLMDSSIKFKNLPAEMRLQLRTSIPKIGGLGDGFIKFKKRIEEYKRSLGGVEFSADECRMAIEALEKEIQSRGFDSALEIFRDKGGPDRSSALPTSNRKRDAMMSNKVKISPNEDYFSDIDEPSIYSSSVESSSDSDDNDK